MELPDWQTLVIEIFLNVPIADGIWTNILAILLITQGRTSKIVLQTTVTDFPQKIIPDLWRCLFRGLGQSILVSRHSCASRFSSVWSRGAPTVSFICINLLRPRTRLLRVNYLRLICSLRFLGTRLVFLSCLIVLTGLASRTLMKLGNFLLSRWIM